MSEQRVSSWRTTSSAERARGRWQTAGFSLLATALASPGVFAQAAPNKTPAAAAVEVAPANAAGNTAALNHQPAPSADDQIRSLREDLARQSAELAAQRTELERLS